MSGVPGLDHPPRRAPGPAARARAAGRLALTAGLLAAAPLGLDQCAGEERTLGSPCIKGEDCLSGFCADQVCVAAAPVLEAAAPEDAATADGDAAGEVDGGSDAPSDQGKPDRGTADAAGGDAADQGSSDAGIQDGAKG